MKRLLGLDILQDMAAAFATGLLLRRKFEVAAP
jgi:hypothetical protein